MNKSSNKEIKRISKNLDRIFYFVTPDNSSLKEDAMERIAYEFSKDLGLRTYGIRSGKDVQDPRTLLAEINEVGIEKFDIICMIKSMERSIILSHNNKEKFMKDLVTKDISTGLIAKSLIDESEITEKVEFED